VRALTTSALFACSFSSAEARQTRLFFSLFFKRRGKADASRERYILFFGIEYEGRGGESAQMSHLTLDHRCALMSPTPLTLANVTLNPKP